VNTPDQLRQESSPDQPVRPSHEEIATLAYQYFLDGGCREGFNEENWFRAEQALMRPRKAPTIVDSEVAKMENEGGKPLPPSEPQSPEGVGVVPLVERDDPLARGKRSSPTRDEIRQRQAIPAPRQSQRNGRGSR